MSEPTPKARHELRPPTIDEALTNASRLLNGAEMEVGNPPVAQRLDELACTWLNIARFLHERSEP
ncbi:hypothetical protein B4N89_27785 [Embleya scabrispora]|uniref:Uncharacterized protein n=1 Tax=Embleya scabrispora TaxID=159449 RepID=A0A1T3P592_9ACTN|nr:hypothetical protein [Embleya scabrispora]OPC84224.1 hypothetical protein B4N89_27785 [Embleya scabrispora]